jgi:hypothetical protein
LDIHHQGGKVKQIYTPDTYVRLRHGGALDLSVCREDKIEILRSVLQSLALNHSANELAQKLISEIEQAAKNGGVWGNISRLVASPKCAVCGLNTNLGGKGKIDLCIEHNNWWTYIKLKRG